MEKDVKWTEDKARNPKEKERAAQFRQQYEQDLATHNLYKRYFYADQSVLPADLGPVLGLPVPAAKPSPGTAPLPGSRSGAAPRLRPSRRADRGGQTEEH